jgi:hypothetical protein
MAERLVTERIEGRYGEMAGGANRLGYVCNRMVLGCCEVVLHRWQEKEWERVAF